MRFRIHGEYSDGSEDSVIIEAETIEEITEMAEKQVAKRGWKNPWSEEI